MSRRTTSLAVASLAAASFITLASASASAKGPEDWALEFIDNAVSNEWGTEPDCFMTWDDADQSKAWTGMTKAACFFTLSLQKAMGYTQQDIYAMWGKNSPTSDYYFDIVNASPKVGATPPGFETYFRRVERAVDIQKGDIFTIGATSTFAGHTMIVTGAPEKILPQINPRYSGTEQFAVPIADSTSSSHGCAEGKYKDSRWSGQCTGGYMTPGAGTGYVRVYTDSFSGILLGFTWSVTSSQTSYYSPSTRPYRIGRLFKLPDPLPTEPPPPPP
ncbi:putative secreted protein [Sorangium cellulosum So ce56]|uniref:Secreted protein n=1 Tax=Sorangium cellulosum (strain So ce56) TaxID=448385 RepID=A9F2N2_SORC5|nr:putative secreted protein [Sorangium cellulosum So ce56]